MATEKPKEGESNEDITNKPPQTQTASGEGASTPAPQRRSGARTGTRSNTRRDTPSPNTTTGEETKQPVDFRQQNIDTSKKHFLQRISEAKKALEAVIPRHLNKDTLLKGAVRAISEDGDLLSCDHRSLLAALDKSMQLGLNPSKEMGQCYLIPFKDQVKLIIGYRGYLALAENVESIHNWYPQTVYKNDEFKVSYGSKAALLHESNWKDRGPAVAWYSYCERANGSASWVVMNRDQIDDIRKQSAYPNGKPWKEHFDAMAMKTVLRSHSKYLPLSPEGRQVIELDDRGYEGDQIIDLDAGDFSSI